MMPSRGIEPGQHWWEASALTTAPSLHPLYKNFCPVSNLPYVSKLVERSASDQLFAHMSSNGLYPELQSAYMKNHSTETALLRVKNDILMNRNKENMTLLVFLDLSAAFDTVDHSSLLTSLQSRFGISGKVLEWFASYLHDRSQCITINGTLSDSFSLQCGVPQGSCLGPILLVIYASKLFEITSRYLPKVHCYADDTQLYLLFKPGLCESHVEVLLHMQRCIDDLRQWMLMDRLKINDEKTKVLLVGTRQQLAKLCVEPLAVGDHLITPYHEAKNLA